VWFSFRVSRSLRVGGPWWLFPVVFTVICIVVACEVVFYVIGGVIYLVVLGLAHLAMWATRDRHPA
jgi:hypothetical protein